MGTGKNKVLLVEGANDTHVFANLCKYHDIPKVFAIEKLIGETTDYDVFDTIAIRLKANVECLGIVLDADLNLSGKWMALCDRLQKRGYRNIPTDPRGGGTIVRYEGLPDVGIWLMPNNELPGELEDFLAMLVPHRQTNWLWNKAETHVNEILQMEILPGNEQRFPAQDRSKAVLHTWLAWQKEPGKPPGQAIWARYFDADAADALALMQWIRTLFCST